MLVPVVPGTGAGAALTRHRTMRRDPKSSVRPTDAKT